MAACSGGFSEASEAVRLLEEQSVAVARQYGVRLVGPNTNGICGARQRDVFLHGFRGQRRIHRDGHGEAHDLPHRSKVFFGAKGHFAAHRMVHGEAGAYRENGVAIGGLARDILRTDHGAATGPVLHDYVLAQLCALRDDARDHIKRAASGKGHDDAYGFGGEGLCGGADWPLEGRCQCNQ